ncbi:MAG: hypothetical protein N4A41_01230 [Crocinitomicaceae bacterium]|jgi:hypothetical protein|nr:hypothetical protein [Crocinitomicaceae bacterium]
MKKLVYLFFSASILVACGTTKEGGDAAKKEEAKPAKVNKNSNNQTISTGENL